MNGPLGLYTDTLPDPHVVVVRTAVASAQKIIDERPGAGIAVGRNVLLAQEGVAGKVGPYDYLDGGLGLPVVLGDDVLDVGLLGGLDRFLVAAAPVAIVAPIHVDGAELLPAVRDDPPRGAGGPFGGVQHGSQQPVLGVGVVVAVIGRKYVVAFLRN